ncbi:cation diffusion facilitator family transporter [Humitalea sp. 24SJ18S-53]|uniref:cation diffusion facilitator family transporter n=1 Tax=Humitalea sp. 24SJ18S-53 TaxID=3422307 RepID=UPI003D67F04C
MQDDDFLHEQRVLTFSVAVTVLIGAAGIACGLLINSSSILFDGVYSLIDAAMTALALGVSALLARGSTRRFQFGFWHLEPMLVLLNSLVLATSCSYAFLGALNDLLGNGRTVSFGPGAWYALAAGTVSLGLYVVMRAKARRLGSDLLAMDARGWLAGGLLSLALGSAFLGVGLLRGTAYEHLVPYLDPAILALLTCVLIPLPLMACWRAAKEVFGVAPQQMDEAVKRIAGDVAARHGFADFSTYVTKTGRAQFVDMTFLAGPEMEMRSLTFFDSIRAEIVEGLGAAPPSHWLNIEFTMDARWL